jgi:glutamate---cysteine ligase / carboxylate-amine ligase
VSPLPFPSSDRMTLGVEMDLQLLDADSLELTPAAPRIFGALGEEGPSIRPEIFQSMLEVDTGVCETPAQVREDLRSSLSRLKEVKPDWLEFACAGSHPFARYADCVIYPAERYRLLLERNQWAARRIMTFALHLHLGMRDGDHAVAMINSLLPYLPHFLALSASSPFWQGEDTGLASSRITVLEALPTAGHAPTYSTWKEFESLHDSLVASDSIASVRDLWWDIRPRPDTGTVELRICDGLPTLSETMALVTLLDALGRRLDAEYRNGRRPTPPPDWMIRENKWRASRYGLDAKILLDERGRTGHLRKEVETLMDSLRQETSRSGSARPFASLERMLERGCSYERQRRILRKSGSMKAVVEALKEEFRTNRPLE